MTGGGKLATTTTTATADSFWFKYVLSSLAAVCAETGLCRFFSIRFAVNDQFLTPESLIEEEFIFFFKYSRSTLFKVSC